MVHERSCRGSTRVVASLLTTSGVRLGVRLLLYTALAWFYVAGATMHSEQVNRLKSRGDQSWFLGVAQTEYHNWHGDQPEQMLRRNIMPAYPAFLAVFYDPSMTNPEHFVQAKRLNIWLSLGLLAILGLIFAHYLPPLASTNLTLVVAFGYFVFKAGYVQPELLYYFFHFLMFLACAHLLQTRPRRQRIGWAAAAGLLAAVTHLTKAAVLPLIGILAIAATVGAWFGDHRLTTDPDGPVLRRSARLKRLGGLLPAALVFAVCFLAPLSPYLSTSKRVFGSYFYNANTRFYIWHDSWGAASLWKVAGVESHWPNVPADQLPSFGRYWQTHTIRQIVERFAEGFRDIVITSYRTYWYYPFVLLLTAHAGLLAWAHRRECHTYVRQHLGVVVFCVGYAAVYLPAAAFYNPVSATGTARYVISHLTPYFFVLSYVITRPPFCHTHWSIGPIRVRSRHLEWLLSAVLAWSLALVIWPRLMTTYGGF